MAQSEFGKLEIFNDFFHLDSTTMGTTLLPLGGGVMYSSVNEGSFALTTDEPGGILAVTTDTGDNDNCCLKAGPFKCADGGCVMEVRAKMADITTGAQCIGFQETVDDTTPVMGMEFATSTMTYNSVGTCVGWNFDSDGTTDTWRCAAADDGTVNTNADTNGTSTDQGAAVNDEWDILRVEIDPNGDARFYHDGKLIKTIADAVPTTTVMLWAVAMIENRSSAASEAEYDYIYAKGNRDWTV